MPIINNVEFWYVKLNPERPTHYENDKSKKKFGFYDNCYTFAKIKLL